jgi:hypothetical protein
MSCGNSGGAPGSETDSLLFFEIVDRGDVGVIQSGKKLRLTLEPADPFGITGELAGKNLNGDVSFQPGVSRPIDFTHTAGSHVRQKFIVADPAPDPRRRLHFVVMRGIKLGEYSIGVELA